ncbi:Class II abasic (AP) endonuclease [Aspergillus nanangensis]|uniref:DNA-(apurinic or apyrimidinic site) endonuclease 2 n=1 Tax=Aspergillus nanangensis TaxID=2582783 RepID=A0AAD4CL17_ASPNN|nr:Class II abasic (AP) endonuclease [Aspergillus nanangensis]
MSASRDVTADGHVVRMQHEDIAWLRIALTSSSTTTTTTNLFPRELSLELGYVLFFLAMGFRITTWNVNGIRNPFSYEPWRGNRTFEAMFDILEADIVVFQETKIQRKDLRDDMVLVPGWDCYFSLPRVKKGYSGVVIYTRNATCAPIRAEEGLTGVLCPPNSSVSFRDLPEDQQIGGYPTIEQLSQLEIDAANLDSEGRCVILEFPAFVLLGLYCPANRDESRDSFRQNFLDIMDARVRNLVAMGKKVFVTGDLNISAREFDAAHAAESIRKGTLSEDEFISSYPRRLFNQLLSGGRVLGERDEAREKPVLHDICRSFHPDRKGMYTCWEQRINARPGNYGSRIDYVLCSLDMQDWFCGSNIQEGLMGSDHCPVYAILKDSVSCEEGQVHIRDIMNPAGIFVGGERRQEYDSKFILPTSGRLIPEFDKRRSIKDMFSRTATKVPSKASVFPNATQTASTQPNASATGAASSDSPSAKGIVRKRSQRNDPIPAVKRSKSIPAPTQTSLGGQKTLQGFFKPKPPISTTPKSPSTQFPDNSMQTSGNPSIVPLESPTVLSSQLEPLPNIRMPQGPSTNPTDAASKERETIIDPIVSKEDWGKLFTKKPTPRCEGHEEACISLQAKKPGINCGRSFWICSRPLGPSGQKEKGTEWRCSTFIWASDWNP